MNPLFDQKSPKDSSWEIKTVFSPTVTFADNIIFFGGHSVPFHVHPIHFECGSFHEALRRPTHYCTHFARPLNAIFSLPTEPHEQSNGFEEKLDFKLSTLNMNFSALTDLGMEENSR
ncbi:hypothetical protein AVEN_189668-1 [Araneus ventricosus]|uniref:Uncharacterized protein n=1 Tax=Araneus ventricosus TaxID=182803 RepID=A0A4Y2M081_ARAVE|nr:hypothetical protein AVEN_189668-1 [Araneus ventricosus]